MKKPVVGFIAGAAAPKGKRMGHAGALISGEDDTAEAKFKVLEECGITVARSPADLGLKLEEATDFYSKIGDQIKKFYVGSTFYIVSSNIEALKNIGLKPNKRTHVLNGGLEAEFQKYEIFVFFFFVFISFVAC